MAPQRQILAILNPAAGGGRARRRFARALPGLREQGAVEVVATRGRGHAETLARESDATIVVAAGGDGTVHEVVNGLMSRTTAAVLAVAPLGTGCDFARNLGMGPRVIAWSGREVRIDLGHATLAGGTSRYFVNAANMGASTAASQRVNASRLLRRAGAAAYVLAGLPEVLRRPTRIYELEFDEIASRRPELLNLTVCNGPRFGGGLCLAPEASLDDGVLHAAAIGPVGLYGLMRALRAGYSADERPRPGVRTHSLIRGQVAGEGVVELDGEIAGVLPVTFSVHPRAISVVV